MKKTRRAILIGLLGILIAGLIVWSLKPKEPTYQERSLSSWLEEWRNSDYNRTNSAAMAIQAIGRNGLPILLARLAKEKSPTERKFWRFFRKVIPEESNDETRVLDAAMAINLLGTEAKSAFPTLTNLFLSMGHCLPASIGLAGIGSEGIAVLLQALTNQNWTTRLFSAVALADARSEWDKVVPALIKVMKMDCRDQQDFLLRGAVANTLVHLHKEPDVIVPVFAEFLTSTNANTRGWAASVLGRIGADARAAIPLLHQASADADPEVSKAAERALQEIDPKAAISP